MKTNRLTEQTEALPDKVRALPKEIRNNLVAAVVFDTMPETLERLSQKAAFSEITDKERSKISKTRALFNYFKENPTELNQENYAVGLYNLTMKNGNYAIKQNLVNLYENELMENKQNNPSLGRKLYSFFSQISEERKKHDSIKAERERIISSLNSAEKGLEEIRNPNGGYELK
jgi:hypothetical protein